MWWPRDAGKRGAWVEAEPAEPQDERPEDGVGHVVARNRVRAAVVAELADPGAEQNRAREGRQRALVMDNRRAGEVLHSEPEQPAAGVPDPMGRDGVDQRERNAEDEVDPQL